MSDKSREERVLGTIQELDISEDRRKRLADAYKFFMSAIKEDEKDTRNYTLSLLALIGVLIVYIVLCFTLAPLRYAVSLGILACVLAFVIWNSVLVKILRHREETAIAVSFFLMHQSSREDFNALRQFDLTMGEEINKLLKLADWIRTKDRG